MKKFFMCVIILMFNAAFGFSQFTGLDLDEALYRIASNSANKRILLRHLGYSLGNYNYDTRFDVNGKYLFVFVIDPGDENRKSFSFIVDTDLVIRNPDEYIDNYENSDIFINLSDTSFEQLIAEYLSQNKSITINRTVLRNTIQNGRFSFFYGKNGVGMHWDSGTVAARAFGPVEIILPYSRVQNYLTSIGKDAFK